MNAPPRPDPIASLRLASFRWTVGGRFASASATWLFSAVMFWQVHELTGSAWWLAAVGLAQFAPSFFFGLIGGAIADRYNRRVLAVSGQACMLAGGGVLLIVSLLDAISVTWILAAAFFAALAATIEAPARQALLPAIVPRHLFPNAITLGATFQQVGFVTGPAAGGLLLAAGGPELAYAVYCALFLASIGTLLMVRLLPVVIPSRAVSIEGIREGVRFVRGQQVILGSMTLDMFAVVFGGATALLPIYATEILDVGALGYGLLAAALDAGAMLMAVALVFLPPIRNTGRALLASVVVFGLATIVFGLSRWYPLSLAAYMAVGMADQISVVMRQTTIQVATPDELRGRVTSVNQLFIGASNRLGAVESGVVAGLTSATFAVVSGGVGCIVVVVAVAAKLPAMRSFRAHDLVAEPPSAPLEVRAAPGLSD